LEKEAWMAWIPFVQNILYFHMIDKSGWHVLIFMLPAIFFINPESHALFAIGVLFSLGLTVFYAFWTANFVKRFGFDPIWTISIFFPIVYFVLLFYMAFSENVQYVATNRYKNAYGNTDYQQL